MNPVFQDLGSSFRIGQINKYYPVDDQNNLSKTVPEYDVLMYDGQNGQVLLSNVRSLRKFSSLNQSDETILESNVKADERDKTPDTRNGAMVIIGFLDSNFNKPFILGTFEHESLLDSEATLEEGVFSSSSFNGLKKKINKDGELEISFNGTVDEEGNPIVEDQIPITIKLGINGDTSLSNGHKLILNAKEDNQFVQILTNNEQSLKITDTPDSEEIELLHKSGSYIRMKVDGSIELVNSNGESFAIDIEFDGLSLTHTNGNTIGVNSDGLFAKTSSGDGLNIASSGEVALGKSSAELVGLVEQTLTQLDSVLTAIQAITVPTAVGPSGVPVNSAQFATAQTQIATIKTKIGTIKGSL